MTTRRVFLLGTAALGLGCARRSTTNPTTAAPTGAPSASRPAPRNILVLGGTGFIGPHLVRHAVARGHRVTIFTRGKRQTELPAEVVRLIGDRNGQLDALRGKSWDAVIDDSATNPEYVRLSTEFLKGNVGRYLFTSSTGVYYPYLQPGAAEDRPVRTTATDPEDSSEAYGVAKAQCERLVLDAFGDHGAVVRPTYIVGPGDTTDRFPYWPVRLLAGGEVLAPGRRSDPVQLIDVRDLAEFMLKLVEDGRPGVYNVAGPRAPTTMEQFLAAARAALDPSIKFTWIDDYAFLEAHEITDSVPWVLLKGNDLHHMEASNAKAIAAGLGFRPLADTVRDTAAWWPSVPAERRDQPGFSITREKEAKALADWHARGKTSARRGPDTLRAPARG